MKAKNHEQLFCGGVRSTSITKLIIWQITRVVCFRLWRRQNYRARTVVVRHRCARRGAAHCSRAGALFSTRHGIHTIRSQWGAFLCVAGRRRGRAYLRSTFTKLRENGLKLTTFYGIYVLYYQIIHPAVVSKSSGAHQAEANFLVLVVGRGLIFSWCGPWPYGHGSSAVSRQSVTMKRQ